jgi:hypothetical protein
VTSLCLVELDAFEPDSGKAGERLKAVVHRLSSGLRKATNHRAPNDDFKLTDFHIIFGSNAEHPLIHYMGSKLTGGIKARLPDLPADAGKGFGIFESSPQSSKTGRTVDGDKNLQLLNRACVTYYGVAGRVYLRRLVDELASDRNALKAFLRKEMKTFETEVANDAQVDPRIRRRYAGLYAAGQLGLHYKILHPKCDWFMDAIASCYRAAIASESISSLSAAEAAACVAKFLDANADRLLKVKGNGVITERSYPKAIGLIPDPNRHGKQVWLKSKVVKKSVFPPGVADSAVTTLVNNGVMSASQQQRVPVLNDKEYFYAVDLIKLRALNKGKDRS